MEKKENFVSLIRNKEKTYEYTVKFSIKYETLPGQNIYILGNLDSLGNWKNKIFQLKWTDGHIWKGKLNMNIDIESFEYKFVCADNKKGFERWEQGKNRIFLFDKKLLSPKNKIKLDCIWEKFVINFNIYYPLKNESEKMQIMGGVNELGNWSLNNNLACNMSLSEPKTIGAFSGRFWTTIVEMSISDPNSFKFEYRYAISDTPENKFTLEREPNRFLDIISINNIEDSIFKDGPLDIIPNNHTYYLINNSIIVLDLNFVADLNYNKIDEYPIFLGSSPVNQEDIEKISQTGVTVILNLQTDEEMNNRKIDWNLYCESFKKNDIEQVRFPIQDLNRRELIEKLSEAGNLLNKLIKRLNKVYICCTAGTSIAAAVVIAYLVKFEDYNVIDAHDYVKSFRTIISPDIPAIQEALKFRD